MRRFMKVALLLVVGFFLGCGGQNADQFPKAAAPKSISGRGGGGGGGAAQDEQAGERKPAVKAADKATSRKIIYTGLVDLIVDDFDGREGQLRQLVEDNEGYIADSDIHNQPGSPRSGTWTVRVPTKHFADFMQALVKLGEVRKRTTNSQDITDAYFDRAAHLKADEAEEKSLLGLLEKTQGRVEDILKVREQLRTVRGQIEQSKSQLQRWDKDVDLATVTVKLLDRRDYSPPLMPDFGSTVGRTFQGSIEALLSFGKGIILVLVALAPWLAVLGLFIAPAVLVRRRRRAANPEVQGVIVQAEEPPEASSHQVED
jgi:hypothetical protein